jgi:hypothetical protein
MAQLRPTALATVEWHGGDDALARELRDQLQLRGLSVEKSIAAGPSLRAQVFATLPALDALAPLVEQMSERHEPSALPWVFLLPPSPTPRKADTRAAIEALLAAHGAVVTGDPELFVECLVLLGAFGAPERPACAIVASEDTWLYAAAQALRTHQEQIGQRPSSLHDDPSAAHGTGAVFVDAATHDSSERTQLALVVPVAGRASQLRHRPVLLGLDLAIQAVELTGSASERIAAGLGAADDRKLRKVDDERFERQLAKCSERVGDHECKVLLSSYDIAITRQAVATTPSAATRIAKKAGYPVEMKPWGAEQPSERDGCLVHRDVQTASEVRRSFAALCDDADCEAVIIRETPIGGKELRVYLEYRAPLGLMLFLERGGARSPLAALAPLREIDAQRLAQSVLASRADDPELDWHALAELLVRASYLVHLNQRIEGLDLARIIVGAKGEGAVVVDAQATLSD